MKPQIIWVLIAFLKERGELTLPRLGRLLWSHHSVEINPMAHYAAPKGTYATFDTSPTSSQATLSECIDFIKDKYSVSKEEAQQLFDAYLSELEDSLIREGRYEMAELGMFVKDDNRIYFVPEEIDWSADFYGMPIVPAQPVKYTEEEKEDVFSTPLRVHETNNDNELKGDEWTLWGVITALVLSALILFVITKTIERLGSDSVPNSAETSKVEVQRDPSTRNIHTKKNELTLPKEEAEGREVIKEHIGKPCVIVVGSFRRSDNAKKMLDKVVGRGYTPFTVESNGYHRVGVQFDCLTEDLYRKLFVLRGEFGKDAWVLVYD